MSPFLSSHSVTIMLALVATGFFVVPAAVIWCVMLGRLVCRIVAHMASLASRVTIAPVDDPEPIEADEYPTPEMIETTKFSPRYMPERQ